MDLSNLYIPKAVDILTPMKQAIEIGQEQQRIGLTRDTATRDKARLGIQQAEEDRTKKTYELQEKLDNTPIYFRDIISPNPSTEFKALVGGGLNLGVEGQKVKDKVYQYVKDMGLVEKNPATGEEFVSRRNYKIIKKELNEDVEMAKGITQSKRDDLIDAITQIDQALQNPEKKLKPEDEKALLAKQSELKSQLNAADNKLRGYGVDVNKEGKAENITGQFITDKGITVGFSDTGGAIVYERDAQGKIVQMPYDEKIHGKKVEKPLATVNIENKLETEEAKEIGKARGEIYKNVVEASRSAETSNFSLDEFEQYLKDVNTSKLAPVATNIAQYAKALGVEIDPKWDAAQALDAVSKRFALSFRNPAGGSGMPGNFSDQDRRYLEAIAPGLGKSSEANRLIIDAMRKVNNRRMETQQLADDYYDVHGTMKGFNLYMKNYADKNPLFTKKQGKQTTETKTLNGKTYQKIDGQWYEK